MDSIKIYLSLGILYLVSKIPTKILIIIGKILGRVSYYVLIKRKKIGLINLKLCFPDSSFKWRSEIIKKHFEHLAIGFLFYSFVFFGSKDKIKKLVTIKNIHNIWQYYKKQPIILLCPHFVGLDMGALRLGLEIVGYSIYSQQKSALLTKFLKNARLRFIKPFGGEIFSRQQGILTVIKKLRATNLAFYYLPDQDLGERDSIFVPFFAFPSCATIDVLPKLVKLTNAKVIPIAVYWENDKYIIEIDTAWDNYPTMNIRNDVVKMNQSIEKSILKNISQYFWLHKRFKTQPDGRNKLYSNI